MRVTTVEVDGSAATDLYQGAVETLPILCMWRWTAPPRHEPPQQPRRRCRRAAPSAPCDCIRVVQLVPRTRGATPMARRTVVVLLPWCTSRATCRRPCRRCPNMPHAARPRAYVYRCNSTRKRRWRPCDSALETPTCGAHFAATGVRCEQRGKKLWGSIFFWTAKYAARPRGDAGPKGDDIYIIYYLICMFGCWLGVVR